MTSSPITSWQIEGGNVEVVTDILFLGSKLTADGDCNHEIRWYLLLGRKAMTNLDSVLKSRDITLLTKARIVKAVVFPVVTWFWDLDHKEAGTPKNWYLQTVVLEKPLELPWTARKSNQPILREIKPEYSLEGLSWSSTILVIWCKQMTHWKSPWCWELLRAEGEEGIRGRDGWTASPMQWTWTWANSGRQWGTGRPGVLQSVGLQRVGHNLVTEKQRQPYLESPPCI